MAQIRGTNISAPIVPQTDEDIFPSHEALYGKGGWRTVQTVAERNAIPELRRELYMIVSVVANDTLYTLKTGLTNTDWEEFVAGGGSDSKQEEFVVPTDGTYEYEITIACKALDIEYLAVRDGGQRGTLKIVLDDEYFIEQNVLGDCGVFFSFNFVTNRLVITADNSTTTDIDMILKFNYFK